MPVPGASAAGLRAILRTEPIAWIELSCVLGLTLRAIWMLWPSWQSIPVEAQGYFIPGGFTESTWGKILLTLALVQGVTVRWRHAGARAAVASCIGLIIGMTIIAYYDSGQQYRGVVPLIIALLIDELIVIYDAWMDILHRPERRRFTRPAPGGPDDG